MCFCARGSRRWCWHHQAPSFFGEAGGSRGSFQGTFRHSAPPHVSSPPLQTMVMQHQRSKHGELRHDRRLAWVQATGTCWGSRRRRVACSMMMGPPVSKQGGLAPGIGSRSACPSEDQGMPVYWPQVPYVWPECKSPLVLCRARAAGMVNAQLTYPLGLQAHLLHADWALPGAGTLLCASTPLPNSPAKPVHPPAHRGDEAHTCASGAGLTIGEVAAPGV